MILKKLNNNYLNENFDKYPSNLFIIKPRNTSCDHFVKESFRLRQSITLNVLGGQNSKRRNTCGIAEEQKHFQQQQKQNISKNTLTQLKTLNPVMNLQKKNQILSRRNIKARKTQFTQVKASNQYFGYKNVDEITAIPVNLMTRQRNQKNQRHQMKVFGLAHLKKIKMQKGVIKDKDHENNSNEKVTLYVKEHKANDNMENLLSYRLRKRQLKTKHKDLKIKCLNFQHNSEVTNFKFNPMIIDSLKVNTSRLQSIINVTLPSENRNLFYRYSSKNMVNKKKDLPIFGQESPVVGWEDHKDLQLTEQINDFVN